MERSPGQREIERVEGNPEAIISRGRDITSLGWKMASCANTLESIKTEAIADGSQKGKAIEKLKDRIGDSHEKLREASDLYKPVGPVIRRYGQALEDCQPIINNAVEDCEEKWAIYQSLPGDKDGPTEAEDVTPLPTFDWPGGDEPDEGPTPYQKNAAAANDKKKAAYDAWVTAATEFDTGYDSWATAFEDACDEITDGLSGSIKDGRWDNFLDFVDVVTEVLSWAALVIGVIAIFCGGFVLLAAVLAVTAFLLTAFQYSQGRRTQGQLAFAALGILPVGKLANLTKFVQFPGLAFKGGVVNAVSRTWKAAEKGPLHTIFTRGGDDAFKFLDRAKVRENLYGPTYQTVRRGNIALYVGNRPLLEKSLPFVRGLSGLEWLGAKFSTWGGHWGRLGTVLSPIVELPSVPEKVDVVFG